MYFNRIFSSANFFAVVVQERRMFLEWNSSWFSYGKQEAAAKNVRKIRCSKVLLNQLLIWVFWQQKRCSIIIVFVLSISKWCWSLIFRFWRAALTCRNFSKSNYWSSYILMCVYWRDLYIFVASNIHNNQHSIQMSRDAQQSVQERVSLPGFSL